MNKEVKELRKKFKKYDIDGYVIPKNDDYFTEYSKINRLKIISNFSGSAGLAIILKDKNYLFTDGRYTIQSEMESGKYFNIISNKFPNTEYAADVEFKIDLINDILASKEIYLGRYYLEKKNGYQQLIDSE